MKSLATNRCNFDAKGRPGPRLGVPQHISMLSHRQVVKRNRHVLEDLGTLVDEPHPLCQAVQVHDLLQDIPHTSPDDGSPAEEEEIG
jgi:hypothetical protein